MGTLRSLTNHTGLSVNGVTLGEPIELDADPHTFEWDDPRIPTGEILADGTVVVGETKSTPFGAEEPDVVSAPLEELDGHEPHGEDSAVSITAVEDAQAPETGV